MSEEQERTEGDQKPPPHIVPATFWPWIVAGLVAMLLKVYTDLRASENARVDDARIDAKDKIQIQREVTALQRELYFQSQRIVAATNRIDSSSGFDSVSATDKQRTAGYSDRPDAR